MEDNIEKVLTQSGADVDFEKLRQMDSYTKELFNRVIAFQMKEHAAWDTSKPFSERIKRLSLHELIFSSPDRDPEKFSHTIAPYYPLRYEIRKIAAYARQVADNPIVLDYPCGNGFIGSLLARENVSVMGKPWVDSKPNQIDPFFDVDCYQRVDDLDNKKPDVVFCSWMPSGVNLTPEIISLSPKMIVYIYSEHQLPDSNRPQVGTTEIFDGLDQNYDIAEEWQVTRPENILQEAWPDLTGNIKEVRKTRIYIDKEIVSRTEEPELNPVDPYDWELDLDMATSVLQAKAFLKSRGMQV